MSNSRLSTSTGSCFGLRFRSLAALLLLAIANGAVALERVEATRFDGDSIVFPDDILGAGPNLLFLSMAKDQDNGEYQGNELLKWHAALEAQGVISARAIPWHFAVMENPPFFVKGVIRRGIAKSYAGKVSPANGAVLYIKDLQRFAASAETAIDGKPTILLYSESGEILGMFKGEVSAKGVAEIAAAIAAVGASENVPAESPQSALSN